MAPLGLSVKRGCTTPGKFEAISTGTSIDLLNAQGRNQVPHDPRIRERLQPAQASPGSIKPAGHSPVMGPSSGVDAVAYRRRGMRPAR